MLFEGVYAARPELSDLVDARILLRVAEATRIARLIEREGALGPWERQWHEAEEWYFEHVAKREIFDLVLDEASAAA